jgi:hypothetical protein
MQNQKQNQLWQTDLTAESLVNLLILRLLESKLDQNRFQTLLTTVILSAVNILDLRLN